MPDRSRRPRDPNQLAKLIVDIATGEVEDKVSDDGKNQAAVELGRKGGLKGRESSGREHDARAAQRGREAAARARWGKSS